MYPTKAIKLLARSRQIDYDEWLVLLESRRMLVKQLLDYGDLPMLGELACLKSEYSFKHSISGDFSEVFGGEDYSLLTKGIFQAQPVGEIEYIPDSGYQLGTSGGACPDGTMKVWGLTSSNEWVVVEIAFIGQDGWKGRGYEKATSVKITKVELADMIAQVNVEPQVIWYALGEASRAWERRCSNMYEQATNIARLIEAEDRVLSAFSEKDRE